MFVYFPIQQRPCHNNIETGKGLNLFDDCAAECVYLCSQEEEFTSPFWGHSKIYTLCTMANSQTDRAPSEIDKNGAAVKVRILLKLGIL